MSFAIVLLLLAGLQQQPSLLPPDIGPENAVYTSSYSTAYAWSADGTRIITGPEGGWKVWDAQTRNMLKESVPSIYKQSASPYLHFDKGVGYWTVNSYESTKFGKDGFPFSRKDTATNESPEQSALSEKAGITWLGYWGRGRSSGVVRVHKGEKYKVAAYPDILRSLAAKSDGSACYVLVDGGQLIDAMSKKVLIEQVGCRAYDSYMQLIDNEHKLFIGNKDNDYSVIDLDSMKVLGHGTKAVGTVSPDGHYMLEKFANSYFDKPYPDYFQYTVYVRDLYENDTPHLMPLDDPDAKAEVLARLRDAKAQVAKEEEEDSATLRAVSKKFSDEGFKIQGLSFFDKTIATNIAESPGWYMAKKLHLTSGRKYIILARFKRGSTPATANVRIGSGDPKYAQEVASGSLTQVLNGRMFLQLGFTATQTGDFLLEVCTDATTSCDYWIYYKE